ncbi:hypothetical protein N9080_04405 [Akkermansiaceae bacterium]|nr:hypothetical protein [Akkermansiaceae bacterium]
MAERFLALLFMLSFVFQSSLAAERITTKNWPKFADIEWGSSKEVVKKALEEKGYECKSGTIKGEELISFSGMLAGKKAGGLARFTSKKLARIGILYQKKDIDFDETTLGVKLSKILMKKYGKPVNVSTDMEVRYAWVNADDPGQVAISLKMIPGTIMVTYVSLARVKRLEKEMEQSKKREEDF